MKLFTLVAGIWCLGFTGLAQAQTQAGTFGACILEDSSGAPLNVGSCELEPPACTPLDCTLMFHWQADDFDTVIRSRSNDAVRDGFEMNGQEAYAPQALIDSDPRDCVYNAVSGALFCFLPAPEAHMIAADGLQSYDALMELMGITPVAGNVPLGESDEADGGRADEIAGLLERMQGKYRPVPNWNCGEIGSDGGATALQGATLYGLETACELNNFRVIGRQGALLADATCSGEGSTWDDEYLLRLDEWGALVVSSLDGAALWQSCE